MHKRKLYLLCTDIPDQVNAEHVEVEENQAIAEDEHVQTSIVGEINSENNANEIQTTKNFENITEEDIEIFLENESIKAAQKGDMQIETHHVPHLDMTFQTEDEAQKFYNSYAFIVGFSVLKAGTYLSRKKEANNAVTRVTFRCNKSGKPKEGDQLAKRKEDKTAEPSKKRKRKSKEGTSTEPAIGKRKSNTVILTGCPAAMVIKLKDTAWQVIRLISNTIMSSVPQERQGSCDHTKICQMQKRN